MGKHGMQKNRIIKVFALLMLFASWISLGVSAEDEKSSQTFGLGPGFDKSNFRKAPTNITSDTLTVQSDKHIFIYTGNVVVTQADMKLTCDNLEGHYSDQNQIEVLIATKNVVLTKGDTIKATSQRGVYTAKDAIVTMTENPALEQNGSTLASDLIKIYLNENRSEAQGKVKVNLLPKSEEKEVPTPTGTPPTPTPLPSTPTPIPGVIIVGQGK